MSTSAPKHFDSIAGQYASSEVHAGSPTIRRLHELLSPALPITVCDVGCGPGHLALSFVGKASRIVGVDAAPNMLRQFEELAEGRSVRAETVLAYAEAIPFPDQAFDVVVSRLAAHHFREIGKVLGEMARLVKSAGVVAVIDLQGYEAPVLDGLNHEIEILHDPTHVRSYTPTKWRSLFEAAGLTVEALESGQTELPGGLTVRRWCEIGSTPPEAEAKIRARLASAQPEHLAEMGIRSENKDFTIPVRTLIITGRKA